MNEFKILSLVDYLKKKSKKVTSGAGHTDHINSVEIVTSGESLAFATCSEDTKITIHEVIKNRTIPTFKIDSHESSVRDIHFHNGYLISTGGKLG